jgi:hypothetical protein
MSTAVATAPRLPLTDDRAWSIEDVAYFLGVSESLVRKLERENRLQALPRISRRLTFDPLVVRAFRANPNAPQLRAVNGGQ